MSFLLALALARPAHAATLTLDSGAVLDGDLAVWAIDGDCEVSVTEGPMVGAIVIFPCARLARFERGDAATPDAPAALDDPAGGWQVDAEPAASASPSALAGAALPVEALAPPPLALPAAFPIDDAPAATQAPDPATFGEDLADPPVPPATVPEPPPTRPAEQRPTRRALGTVQLPARPHLSTALGREPDSEEVR